MSCKDCSTAKALHSGLLDRPPQSRGYRDHRVQHVHLRHKNALQAATCAGESGQLSGRKRTFIMYVDGYWLGLYGLNMWSLRPSSLPSGFIAPCLPTAAPCAPSGDQWFHEIKHDGIRVIARKDDKRVRLYSRPGNDLTSRFPLIVEALGRLRCRSCITDGEAVACGDDGIALFQRIRYRRHDASVFMYAFDLIELNGDDLRREPLERRKAALTRLLVCAHHGVQLNEHLEAEGALVFEHACRMGLEGIVSKRKGSSYRSGRSQHWVKAKNPNSPAVTRLVEEDWGR